MKAFAMYHLSVKTISRASGRSATAAAAYRSGEKIIDERTGEIHDYTRKQGVEHSEIVLPKNAPEWANDSNTLWNAVEQAETRKNSTVAREFEIAIPKELSLEQGKDLVRDFTHKLVEKHGFAAEFSIHKDHEKDWQGREKGFEGYHAHILCSTRRLEPQGFTEKTRELDGGQRGREEVEYWREQWAKTANEHLKEAKIDKQIDHRSLKEQGIDREPTIHLGVAATAKERRGEETEIGEANRRIEKAYEQGLKERKELEELSPVITRYGICIRSALEDRERLKKLTEKMDRGADEFVRRFEAMQKQKEMDRQRELEQERLFERFRSRDMER
jgi:ATP-dependent exoDNAse (exonuclease V) alpha subunit